MLDSLAFECDCVISATYSTHNSHTPLAIRIMLFPVNIHIDDLYEKKCRFDLEYVLSNSEMKKSKSSSYSKTECQLLRRLNIRGVFVLKREHGYLVGRLQL